MPEHAPGSARIESSREGVATEGSKILGLSAERASSLEATLLSSGAQQFYADSIDHALWDTSDGLLQKLGISVYVTTSYLSRSKGHHTYYQWVIERPSHSTESSTTGNLRSDIVLGTDTAALDDALAQLAGTLLPEAQERLRTGEFFVQNVTRRHRTEYAYLKGHPLAGTSVFIEKLETVVKRTQSGSKKTIAQVPAFVEITSSDPAQIDECARTLNLTFNPKHRGMTNQGVLTHYGLLK